MQGTLSANPGSLAVSPRADRRFLFAALALAGLAALLTFMYLRGLSGRTELGGSTLPVVVAARDIPIGVTITGEMVEMKALPEAAVVTGAVRASEDVVGQRVRYPAAKGEQFTGTRLIDAAKVPALSFQIPPGRRGFTIPV